MTDDTPTAELVPVPSLAVLAAPLPPGTVSPLVQQFGALAAGSHRSTKSALDKVARYLTRAADATAKTFPWHVLRAEHALFVRIQLQAGVDGADPDPLGDGSRLQVVYANKVLSALRGVARGAYEAGHLSATEYGRIKLLKSIRGTSLPAGEAGRSLSEGEIDAVFRQAATRGARKHGRRPSTASRALDCALLAILYGAGARRHEACALQLGDYWRDRSALHILGKGHKQRLVPLEASVMRHLDRWVALRGDVLGPLLCPVERGGALDTSRPLAVRSVDDRVKRIVGTLDVTSHDFRRTFATSLLERGVDLATVQRLLGHADPKTTTGYDRRGPEARRRAVGKLYVPFEEFPNE